MSEQEAEPSEEQSEDEGVAGLQESRLDSVTGGGSPRMPHMDLQDTRYDTVQKDNSGGRETKESEDDDRGAPEGDS